MTLHLSPAMEAAWAAYHREIEDLRVGKREKQGRVCRDDELGVTSDQGLDEAEQRELALGRKNTLGRVDQMQAARHAPAAEHFHAGVAAVAVEIARAQENAVTSLW